MAHAPSTALYKVPASKQPFLPAQVCHPKGEIHPSLSASARLFTHFNPIYALRKDLLVSRCSPEQGQLSPEWNLKGRLLTSVKKCLVFNIFFPVVSQEKKKDTDKREMNFIPPGTATGSSQPASNGRALFSLQSHGETLPKPIGQIH